MLISDDIRRMALALPQTEEAPHFEATSFKVKSKIFCTMGADEPSITVKLGPDDQHNLSEGYAGLITPTEGYWGRNGWTRVRFVDLDHALVESVLRIAWTIVAPKRLAATLT